MRSYDPFTWYWIVGGDESKVWSSAAQAYVPISDASYAAWCEVGDLPTRIASEADLCAALKPAGIVGPGGVREATGYTLVSVLTDDEVVALGKAKLKDQHLFGKRTEPFPENNPKIKRFADLLGMAPKAWFDRALGVTG